MSCFIVLHFIAHLSFFYKLKVYKKPCATLRQTSLWAPFFPIAFAHFMSLCHTLVIHPVFQTLFRYYIRYGDL